MLSFLPGPLRGVLTGAVLVLNTLCTFSLLLVPALLKLVCGPLPALRRLLNRLLNGITHGWVAVNNGWIAAVNRQPWDVQGLDGLKRAGWYLVLPNHQSWVDILVLQRVFHGRIPFLKFFLKRELIWVPVIGLAWWALDFPFMRRGRSVSDRARDLATTRRACEKFKTVPTAVINFVEGTRFTAAKHAEQASPLRHLLKPKIGALGIALATMGEQFESLLDVTVVYPQGTPNFWQLLCGRLGPVVVRVEQREIPAELVGGDLLSDPKRRHQLGDWVEAMWRSKDEQIERLLKEAGRD